MTRIHQGKNASMKARKQVQVNEYWKPQPVESPFLRDLSLTYAGQTEGLSLRSTDISGNGMFISTGLRFPEGAILKLRFRLTRTNVEIATCSEVCYCLGGLGFGVKFIDLPPQSVQAIEKEIHMAQRDAELNGTGVRD
jgi:hypothetical protein